MNFENTLCAIGAFNGMQYHGGKCYLQSCIFIRCANSPVTNCGKPTKNSSNNYIDKMSFIGNFSTSCVFPECLVVDGNDLEIVTRLWL